MVGISPIGGAFPAGCQPSGGFELKIRFRIVVTVVVTLLVCAGLGPVAFATSPSDPPPSPTAPVIGTLDGPTKAKNDGITLKTHGDTKVATFELTYPVGSFSGWHYHPGIVIAVVKSGTVVRRVGCRSKTFTAGESFTEVDPHYVSNYYTSTDDSKAAPAILEITQIYPADAPSRRIEAKAPHCRHGVTTG